LDESTAGQQDDACHAGPLESGTVRILLIDSSPITQMGIRMIVETVDELKLVGIMHSEDIDAEAIRKLEPDVMLINLPSLPQDSLGRLAEFLKGDSKPSLRVLFMVNDWDSTAAHQVSASANGFIFIQAKLREFIAAINLVAAGYSIMVPERQAPQRDLFGLRSQLRKASRVSRTSVLTRREVDVLYAVAQGWTNAEIARKLVLSESTIKSHVQNLLTKLGLPNRASAVALAYEAGILSTRPAALPVLDSR
jgi:DNA-binding NarL/FixJ family response regulator